MRPRGVKSGLGYCVATPKGSRTFKGEKKKKKKVKGTRGDGEKRGFVGI